MTRDRAISFARAHLLIGIRVKRIESTDADVVIESEELDKLLAERE